MFRSVIIALLVVGVTACGWHLRGSLDLPDELRSVHLNAAGVDRFLREDLERALTLSQVKLEPADTAAFTISLSNVEQERRVNSVGTDGVADSIRLGLATEYTVTDRDGNLLVTDGSAQVVRVYNFDRDNVAAKAQEEQLVLKELRRELAQQLLRQIRFALVNPPAQVDENSTNDETTETTDDAESPS
jgi:LPS-assembly lipoprotein